MQIIINVQTSRDEICRNTQLSDDQVSRFRCIDEFSLETIRSEFWKLEIELKILRYIDNANYYLITVSF